jgi:glycosyltransferase involved in cell wall biosynthesis
MKIASMAIMENPLVSVVIPAYNRPDFLEKISIPSVFSQSYKNWELWVVDDGSTEDVKGIVEKFREKNSNIQWGAMTYCLVL